MRRHRAHRARPLRLTRPRLRPRDRSRRPDVIQNHNLRRHRPPVLHRRRRPPQRPPKRSDQALMLATPSSAPAIAASPLSRTVMGRWSSAVMVNTATLAAFLAHARVTAASANVWPQRRLCATSTACAMLVAAASGCGGSGASSSSSDATKPRTHNDFGDPYVTNRQAADIRAGENIDRAFRTLGGRASSGMFAPSPSAPENIRREYQQNPVDCYDYPLVGKPVSGTQSGPTWEFCFKYGRLISKHFSPQGP